MDLKRPRGLFITGTGTGVGKTHVAAIIARALRREGHRVGVYKPVASGCKRGGDTLVSDDAVQLWEAAGRPGELERVCPQRFEAALAPHLAARAEGKEVDGALLRNGLDYWAISSDFVLVEGAGGLLSPLTDDEFVADLAADFQFPLVVVTANRLGTIHETLATLVVAATFRDGLDVAGLVLNSASPPPADASAATNLAELRRLAVPPVLATVEWDGLEFSSDVDWHSLG